MSAHVLLNLLNEIEKRYKMQGLPNILSFSCNEFNKFYNTESLTLDYFIISALFNKNDNNSMRNDKVINYYLDNIEL